MVDIIFIVSVAIEGLPNQATTKTLEKSSVSSSAQGQAMVLSLFSIKWKQKKTGKEVTVPVTLCMLSELILKMLLSANAKTKRFKGTCPGLCS